MSAVIFGTLIALIIINVPIVFVLGLAALAAVLFTGDLPLTVIPQRILVGLDSFPLLAAPLFIFAGEIMSNGAMSDRLVKFATALLGHIRGSLAMITVVVSMLFAGVSGSATADTAAVGSILIPAMIRRGYKANFATALQASAGCIGPIIPPSVVMVIYGWVAGVSVGALFLGGVVPGFLIGFGLMAICYFHARAGGPAYLGSERASIGEIGRTGTQCYSGARHAAHYSRRNSRWRLYGNRSGRGRRGLRIGRRAVDLPRYPDPGITESACHVGDPLDGGHDGCRYSRAARLDDYLLRLARPGRGDAQFNFAE